MTEMPPRGSHNPPLPDRVDGGPGDHEMIEQLDPQDPALGFNLPRAAQIAIAGPANAGRVIMRKENLFRVQRYRPTHDGPGGDFDAVARAHGQNRFGNESPCAVGEESEDDFLTPVRQPMEEVVMKIGAERVQRGAQGSLAQAGGQDLAGAEKTRDQPRLPAQARPEPVLAGAGERRKRPEFLDQARSLLQGPLETELAQDSAQELRPASRRRCSVVAIPTSAIWTQYGPRMMIA